jgi:hypothetical protein
LRSGCDPGALSNVEPIRFIVMRRIENRLNELGLELNVPVIVDAIALVA